MSSWTFEQIPKAFLSLENGHLFHVIIIIIIILAVVVVWFSLLLSFLTENKSRNQHLLKH